MIRLIVSGTTKANAAVRDEIVHMVFASHVSHKCWVILLAPAKLMTQRAAECLLALMVVHVFSACGLFC